MYSPLNNYRRQSEWDDHAETYPMSHNGPDLWYLIDIKQQGVYKLSMYFFNKDGHGGNNRFRDFLVEIYPVSATLAKPSDTEKIGKIAEAQTRHTPPLARTRVVNFWGGVHKSFEVNGEGKYFVRVANNFTFCTIMSSVCVDRIDTQANNQLDFLPTQNVPHCPPQFPPNIPDPSCRIALNIWQSIIEHNTNLNTSANRREIQLQILRTTKYSNTNAGNKLFSILSHHLNQWNKEQTQNWNNFVRESQERSKNNEPKQIKVQEAFLNNPKQNPWTGWAR
jgi:hypothetical protein